jgi:hypothetical protein
MLDNIHKELAEEFPEDNNIGEFHCDAGTIDKGNYAFSDTDPKEDSEDYAPYYFLDEIDELEEDDFR